METSSTKAMLVTGASSGIGKEIARKFAKNNHNVVLVARNKDSLNSLTTELINQYKVKAFPLVCDLSKSDQREQLIKTLKEKNISINILVNDAGVNTFGNFENNSLNEVEKMLHVNVEGLTVLTHLLLPHLLNEHNSHIINIASISGYGPGAGDAVYYASKSYVISFSLALREELKKRSVNVTTICPGFTNTPFLTTSGAKNATSSILGLKLLPSQTPEKVADVTYNAFRRNKSLVVCGLFNKLVVASFYLVPMTWKAKIVKYFNY